MTHTIRHGEIPALLNRKVIEQGNSKMVSLTPFLDGSLDVKIYVLKNGKRHLLIEIDKFPEGTEEGD